MTQPALVLCEIADEHEDVDNDTNKELLFTFGKKQWQVKPSLAASGKELAELVEKFNKARTKKLCLKAIGKSLVLLQRANVSAQNANTLDIQLATELFPLVFKDYAPTLEFELVKEQQNQRELKSYVTTLLYHALSSKHQEHEEKPEDQELSMPSCFKSKLRKYQQRTVSWMCSRERVSNQFPASYTLLQTSNSQHQVFKHKYCLQFYAFQESLPTITLPPGGILADEMGLGKTVELLATVLLNPRKDVNNTFWLDYLENALDNVPLKKRRLQKHQVHCICMQEKRKKLQKIQCNICQLWQHRKCIRDEQENYMCPNCWTEAINQNSDELVMSAATVIVSPNVIKMQWYHEISKHINSSLKVLLYPGLHSGVWYSPMELAQYDIVLTDYEILRNEIHHTPRKSSNREMRYEQRYMRPTSPLLMVDWWRVCLDEGQMVGGSSTNTSEMVHELPAINRWAITGTPIQRTIDDLVPLLHFIGYHEACQPRDAWQTVSNSFLLNHNTAPLLELLQHCMWRTCKSQVEEELGIPPQTEEIHRLELSNLESLYYREEHANCTEQFLAAVAKHAKYNPDTNSSSLSSISPKLLKNILQPFLRIRKTCSVPVVTKKNVSTTNYMNPQELLKHLKSNNELECKRELRTWASSYNGIAAIQFIRKKFDKAVQFYKLVLKLAKDYNQENISVDSLLQIHALFNLLQASKLAPIPLDEDEMNGYYEKLYSLETKYLHENSAVLKSAAKAYDLKLFDLDTLTDKSESSVLDLFATLIQIDNSWNNIIYNKIADEFFAQNVPLDKRTDTSSMTGFLYVINNWHRRTMRLFDRLCVEFEYLNDILVQQCGTVERGHCISADTSYFIKHVSECHLANILDDNPNKVVNEDNSRQHNRCRLCKIKDYMNQFECMLFMKEMDRGGVRTEGTENPSIEMIVLKTCFTYIMSRPELSDWKVECKNKLEILEAMQSLAKLQIKYWIEAEYVIKTFDELDMCKMRIMLTEDPNQVSNHRIMYCQLDEQTQFNLANISTAQLNYTRLSGRLKYLKHLKDDDDDKPCPICQTQDDERYVMLSCGHFLCQLCLDRMRKNVSRDSITKCPLCREDSPQLYYSVRKSIKTSKIVGDFSTKITCIVELVLKIQQECAEKKQEQEKILIFSQWMTILEHIASALQLNGINYRSQFSQRNIDDFKDPEQNVCCLLMPLARGSKGLNLIEATHVFLVEPILTPGEELQAIRRVHRFGQSKPTTVHRFIVNETIEENILTLIRSVDDSSTLSTHWDLDNMTLESLKNLFILKEKE